PELLDSTTVRSREKPRFDMAELTSAIVYSRICPHVPFAYSISSGISSMLRPFRSLMRFSNEAWLGEEASKIPPGHTTRAISERTKFTRSAGRCSRTSEKVTNEKWAHGKGSDS